MNVGWPKPSLFYLMIYSLVLSNPLFSFTLYILCNLFSSILYFQVMYVGVTYTGNGPYRSEVPAVSSRSLDSASLFQVNLHFCLCQWLCFGELFDSIFFLLSLIWLNSEVIFLVKSHIFLLSMQVMLDNYHPPSPPLSWICKLTEMAVYNL